MRKKYYLPFSRMVTYNLSASCDIDNDIKMNDIVKSRSMKIWSITSSLKDMGMNKPPIPTNVFDNGNTPISHFNIMDIDDIRKSSSYSLKDITRCSTTPYKNIPRSENDNIHSSELLWCWNFEQHIRVKRLSDMFTSCFYRLLQTNTRNHFA